MTKTTEESDYSENAGYHLEPFAFDDFFNSASIGAALTFGFESVGGGAAAAVPSGTTGVPYDYFQLNDISATAGMHGLGDYTSYSMNQNYAYGIPTQEAPLMTSVSYQNAFVTPMVSAHIMPTYGNNQIHQTINDQQQQPQPKTVKRRRVSEHVSSLHSSQEGSDAISSLKCFHVHSSECYHISLDSHIRDGRSSFIFSRFKSAIPTLASKNVTCDAGQITSNAIYEFLFDGSDSELVFYCPRVGQKSYGSEKRFFSPSPFILLNGKYWFCNKNDCGDKSGDKHSSLKKMSASVAADPSGVVTKFLNGGVDSFIINRSDQSDDDEEDDDEGKYEAAVVFKNMFIGDLKKIRDSQKEALCLHDASLNSFFNCVDYTRTKKEFEFFLRLSVSEDNHEDKSEISTHTPQDSYIGTFRSSLLSLISKPSKKKSTTRINRPNSGRSLREFAEYFHMEVIMNGDQVSIFNRLKSQTVSTKYASVSKQGDLIGTTATWDPFTIVLYENGVAVKERVSIPFGSVVRLEGPNGWKSDLFIIRCIDQKTSNIAEIDSSNILSHLQKVVFHSLKEPTKYLSMNGNANNTNALDITYASFVGENPPDSFLWSIVGVSGVSSRWFRSSSHQDLLLPVTPVPDCYFSSFLKLPENQSGIAKGNMVYLESCLPAHAVLETLDLFSKRVSSTQEHTFETLVKTIFDFDVYLGNVFCKTLISDLVFVTDAGRLVETGYLDLNRQVKSCDVLLGTMVDALEDLLLGMVIEIPCLTECFSKGQWASNLLFQPKEAPKLSHENAVYGGMCGANSDNGPMYYGFPKSVGSFSRSLSSCVKCYDSDDHQSNCITTVTPAEPAASISLPLIFVRKYDGVVYRTKQTVTFELPFVEHV